MDRHCYLQPLPRRKEILTLEHITSGTNFESISVVGEGQVAWQLAHVERVN